MVASPVMALNAMRYRMLGLGRYKDRRRLHLGPGQSKYIEGWLNIDANMFTAKCDMWLDLRGHLPFRSDSVEAVYSHHVVEHLPDLRAHFQEVFRILQEDGIYRVAGPNGDAAIDRFIAGDASWFGDFPDKRRSVGGRFENFVFCRQEHLTILTRSFLDELLTDAGFVEIAQTLPGQSRFPELFEPCARTEESNTPDWPHTIVMEARKPSRAR